tara:strand:- start:140 stop:514 length:375 start_codon:yes stop_codon:yes gene_type:complete
MFMRVSELVPGMILQVSPNNKKNQYDYDCFRFVSERETVFEDGEFRNDGNEILIASPGFTAGHVRGYRAYDRSSPGPAFGVYLGWKNARRMVCGFFKHHHVLFGDQVAIVFGQEFRYIEPLEEE